MSEVSMRRWSKYIPLANGEVGFLKTLEGVVIDNGVTEGIQEF
jgi:hypothetical protein